VLLLEELVISAVKMKKIAGKMMNPHYQSIVGDIILKFMITLMTSLLLSLHSNSTLEMMVKQNTNGNLKIIYIIKPTQEIDIA